MTSYYHVNKPFYDAAVLNASHGYDITMMDLIRCEVESPEWLELYSKVNELRNQFVVAKQKSAEFEAKYKDAPANTVNVEKSEEASVIAEVIEKATAAPKPAKAAKAVKTKAGGVNSKEKPIVNMSASELKNLSDKHTIDYSTVNFRKTDEKDAFRSKLAKVLGRSSELNYSVK